MGRPKLKLRKTKYPGVYRIAGRKNAFLLRAKVKQQFTEKEVERKIRFDGGLPQAAARRAELVEELKQAASRVSVRPTVTEFIERYVELRAESWKKSHREFMGYGLGSAAEAFGSYYVDAVRPETIVQWLLSLRSRSGALATKSTMTSYLNRIREVFEMARLEGLLEINPAHPKLVKVPRGRPSRQPVALTPEQAKRLVSAARAYDEKLLNRSKCAYMGHHPYIIVALVTGCRSGELTALLWEVHVQLQTGQILVEVGHYRGEVGSTKTGRTYTFEVPPAVVRVLGRHWRLMQRHGTPEQIASGLVFPSTLGTYSTGRVRYALERCCERAGLPRMVPHDLRHTSTTMWNRVAKRRVAMMVIGHEDERTHDRYTHPYDEEVRQGLQDVASMIGLEE